ncbi:MAG: alcohol dehydrogenase catalytic domain-containing protein [Novosphingobium sp.]
MSRQVRAAVCFAPNEPQQIVELALADPGPDQVLVRFIATGLCHSDQHVLDGGYVTAMPIVLGHEGLGEVVEVGEGVTEFAPGDRVMPFLVPDCGKCPLCLSGRTNMCVEFQKRREANATPFSLDGKPVFQFMAIGSFAEMTVVYADMLTKVPVEADPSLACCIACGVTTGIGAATISAKVSEGASVAVFGAGGVGLSVIQGAWLAGAGTIIAVDLNESKREPAIAVGATHFVNAGDVADAVAEVRALTGMGADFTFECVGIPALAGQALEAANPFWGVSVCVGVMPTGSQLATLPFNLMSGRRWTGSFMGGAKRQDVRRFVEMFTAGDYSLDAIVSHRLKLEDINRGFAMMKSGEAVRSVIEY